MDTTVATVEQEECTHSQFPTLNSQDNYVVDDLSQNLKSRTIDQHPYARGSVIEILCRHHSKENIDEDRDYDDWDEEQEEIIGEGEIRLADIIDRAPSLMPNHVDPAYRWKYYVHYRDFNRRMDEWVEDPKRIVGPPSAGNIKVRAMKKARIAKDEQERRASSRVQVSTDTPTIQQRANSRRNSNAVANNLISTSINTSSSGEVPQTMIEDDTPIVTDLTLKSANSTRLRRKSSRTGGNLSSSSSLAIIDDTILVGPESSSNNASSKSIANHPPVILSESATIVAGEGVPVTNEDETAHIRDKVVTLVAREMDEHEGLDEASLREHEEVTKVKNVAQVQIGKYVMDTWYYSPLPKELFHAENTPSSDNLNPSSSSSNAPMNTSTTAYGVATNNIILPILYVCEFTLQFFARKEELLRYQARGSFMKFGRHPPGNEIYRSYTDQGFLLSMFEVDGLEAKTYCQNLCYIAKLFLDHKTLYYDVDPFLFYVLCEVDERGFHPVGYFSKEKYSDVGYNLACILTFPCHQRKGYGRFLISFSYELSKKEEKVGSPEKPMSDLGQQAYKPYWASVVIGFLLNQSSESSLSIMEISKRTSIMVEDIIFTLNMLGLLKYINDVYFISAERSLLEELAKKYPIKDPRVDPSKLHWTPFITDVKRDKFSIHSKRPSVEESSFRASGSGGF